MKKELESKSEYSGSSSSSSRQVEIFVQFSGFKSWFKFFSERIALFVYLLTAAGYVLTANYALSDGSKSLPLRPFFWTLVIETLFLITLRVMDDLKDVDTDILAHPERPLPRGLVTAREASIVVHGLVSILIINGIVLAIVENLACGLLCIATTLYYYAMFKEFGCGHWLSARPILYVISHQLVVLLMVLFPVAAFHGASSLKSILCWHAALLQFCGSFTFEVCRKLDPTAHVALGTYLIAYGKFKTFLMILFAVAIGAWASYVMAVEIIMWPFLGFLLLTVLILFWKQRTPGTPLEKDEAPPKGHKIVELICTLITLLTMYIVPIKIWSGVPKAAMRTFS
ncbi:hypothetical protein BGZ80_007767 [Entomortierella chlamydospora]|uniref:Uncharacterized protein n=1 Tax=Entomortierella chlamydospora TaxID=101097 RepID=A0A9P6MYU4_9FUNG|nr:hypothetical protein BGZ79_004847 [Entomortierella chlamydospora]KAG0017922.1 hypothetical protein BGZ80_007767 [Entomortierella chlamydospora]